MPKKPQLFIHAGHPKCGSTAVRSLLLQNAAELASRGVYLLDERFGVSESNAISRWPLWFVEDAAKQPKGFLTDALTASVEASRPFEIKSLVLSAENLSDPCKAELLDEALDRFDTHLIYYMRRQDHFLVSSWRQWALKRGTSFEQHVIRRLAEGKPDFEATLHFWENRVGRDKIHARFIDPRFLTGGDLAKDLFDALGLAPLASLRPENVNPSPDRAVLLFVQRHPHLFDGIHDDRAIQLLAELDERPAEPLSMDRHLQKSVQMVYEPANQRILQSFGRPQDEGLPIIPLDSRIKRPEYFLTDRDLGCLERLFAKIIDRTIRGPASSGAHWGGNDEPSHAQA